MPARKRRRIVPLLSSLGERAAGQPAIWAPVAARLLFSYGLALPASTYAEWLRQLAAAAPAHFPSHFMADEHDADAALWLLRLAHALALAWPLHFSRGGSGAGSIGAGGGLQEEELPLPAVVEEQWAVSARRRTTALWCTECYCCSTGSAF